MVSAFQASKQALADAAMLMHPSTTSPIFLVTDASDTGIGPTLQQRMELTVHRHFIAGSSEI